MIGASHRAAKDRSEGRTGLSPNRNHLRTGALSLQQRVREARVRARIDSIFGKSCPPPAFGQPLPEGEGPRSKMIPVGRQPRAALATIFPRSAASIVHFPSSFLNSLL